MYIEYVSTYQAIKLVACELAGFNVCCNGCMDAVYMPKNFNDLLYVS